MKRFCLSRAVVVCGLPLLMAGCALSGVQWQADSDPRVGAGAKLVVVHEGDDPDQFVHAARDDFQGGWSLDVWRGDGSKSLRTRNGTLIEARGYGDKTLAVLDDCPAIASLAALTQPAQCKRTWLTARQGQFRSSTRVTLLPPEPASIRLGKQIIRGVMVRERLHTLTRTGNFYFFDQQGRYVMSRQWLTATDAFDVFAVEQAQ